MSDPNDDPTPEDYSAHYDQHHPTPMHHHQDQHEHHHQDQHLQDEHQHQHQHEHQHHQDQHLHQDDHHHPSAGEYSHYPPLYDYPHNTAAHGQGNHTNPIPAAYDYFQPTPYNEDDQQQQQQHQQQQQQPQQHTVEQHRGHSVHQVQYPPAHQHMYIQHPHPAHHQIQHQHQPHQHPHHHQHPANTQHEYPHDTHPTHAPMEQNPTVAPEKKRISANEAWEIKFQLLLQFRMVHNHVDVPQTYKQNKSLGKWVGKQREQYKIYCHNLQCNFDERSSCAMTEERVRKLNEVGFKWSMGKGQYGKIHGIFDQSGNMTRQWEEKLSQLELFKRTYGHLNVPPISSTGHYEAPISNHLGNADGEENEPLSSDLDIKSLSRWVKNQRQKYMDVERGKVAAGQALEMRFRRLMDLGLDLNVSNAEMNRGSTARDMRKVKEQRNTMWELRYKELCDYVQKHGHANVPASDKENLALARWVGVQRDCYRTRKRQLEESQPATNVHLAKKNANTDKSPVAQKSNPLTDERIEQLLRIGFEFSIHDNRWEGKLKELAAYKKKKGHMRVRHFENKQLYEWIGRQRSLFKDYMQGNALTGNTMNSERISGLEKLGFNWLYNFESVSAKALKSAMDRAESGCMKKKKPKHRKSGDENEDMEHDEADVNPVGERRYDINVQNVRGEPTQKINMDGTPAGNEEGNCSDNLVATDEATIDHFNHPIPINAALEPYSLHDAQSLPVNAVHFMNPMHKKGTKPHLWQQSYEKLVEFQQKNGHCKVPGRYPPDPKLGVWVKLQREDFKHLQEGKPSPMNAYRIGLLEKIGFDWTLLPVTDRINSWNARFAQLKEFKSQYGHCNVPQQYSPNKPLGKWVSKQREAYRAFAQWKPTSLSKEKIKLLETLGFQFKVGRGKATRTWDSYMEDLISFKEKYCHTNIPLCYTTDPSLGKWAYQQRFNMKKRLSGKATNGMIKKRLEKLKSIGFSFHVKEPDTGRKRRSDFGTNRQSTKKQKNSGSESENGHEDNQGGKNDGKEIICLQEKEENLDPVPIEDHNPDEIRDMDCLENVCDAFAL